MFLQEVIDYYSKYSLMFISLQNDTVLQDTQFVPQEIWHPLARSAAT